MFQTTFSSFLMIHCRFAQASNLSDADCMPYDGHDQQVSDSSSDDDDSRRPPTASAAAPPPPSASASGRPLAATGPVFSLDRITPTPERSRASNGLDLRPATSAVLGGSAAGPGPLGTETTRETDLSALNEDLFSPKEGPAPSGEYPSLPSGWVKDEIPHSGVNMQQREARRLDACSFLLLCLRLCAPTRRAQGVQAGIGLGAGDQRRRRLRGALCCHPLLVVHFLYDEYCQ